MKTAVSNPKCLKQEEQRWRRRKRWRRREGKKGGGGRKKRFFTSLNETKEPLANGPEYF
jgi:hypothetical protein